MRPAQVYQSHRILISHLPFYILLSLFSIWVSLTHVYDQPFSSVGSGWMWDKRGYPCWQWIIEEDDVYTALSQHDRNQEYRMKWLCYYCLLVVQYLLEEILYSKHHTVDCMLSFLLWKDDVTRISQGKRILLTLTMLALRTPKNPTYTCHLHLHLLLPYSSTYSTIGLPPFAPSSDDSEFGILWSLFEAYVILLKSLF